MLSACSGGFYGTGEHSCPASQFSKVRRIRRDLPGRLPDDRAMVQRLKDAEALDQRADPLRLKPCPLRFDPVEHRCPRLRLVREVQRCPDQVGLGPVMEEGYRPPGPVVRHIAATEDARAAPVLLRLRVVERPPLARFGVAVEPSPAAVLGPGLHKPGQLLVLRLTVEDVHGGEVP